jgi:hypothetical protein
MNISVQGVLQITIDSGLATAIYNEIKNEIT